MDSQTDPVLGHEQAGRRPVVVLSANWWTASPAPVIAIVPMSTKVKGLPHQIAVPTGTVGLSKASYLLPEHLRFVDRRRLVEPIGGSLPEDTMTRLRTVLYRMLG